MVFSSSNSKHFFRNIKIETEIYNSKNIKHQIGLEQIMKSWRILLEYKKIMKGKYIAEASLEVSSPTADTGDRTQEQELGLDKRQ